MCAWVAYRLRGWGRVQYEPEDTGRSHLAINPTRFGGRTHTKFMAAAATGSLTLKAQKKVLRKIMASKLRELPQAVIEQQCTEITLSTNTMMIS